MVNETTTPWQEVDPISLENHRVIRREMMFNHFKWDPQMQDVSTLGRTPLVLKHQAWNDLRQHAEVLYEETLAIEHALLQRPVLIGRLGLPGRIRTL